MICFSRLFCTGWLGLALLLAITGCAQPFAKPDIDGHRGAGPDGPALFEQTFAAHGGAELAQLRNLNVGLNGKWRFLIKRIQPQVTDYKFRVTSQERLLPNQGVYTALYEGPGGTKKVVRTPESIRVFYNNVESFDEDALASSALTADAFFVFSLGPLALKDAAPQFVRLADDVIEDKTYQRIYAVLEPGFGYAERDEIILWIDPETQLTKRIVITLEGYAKTQGAHVDVTFTNYTRHGGYVLPTKFYERVLAPIKIHAHDWHLTGLDINRDYGIKAINAYGFVRAADAPAQPIN